MEYTAANSSKDIYICPDLQLCYGLQLCLWFLQKPCPSTTTTIRIHADTDEALQWPARCLLEQSSIPNAARSCT